MRDSSGDQTPFVSSMDFQYNNNEELDFIINQDWDIETEFDPEDHWWNNQEAKLRIIALQTDALVRCIGLVPNVKEDNSIIFMNEGNQVFQYLTRTSPFYLSQVGMVINVCTQIYACPLREIAPIAYLVGQEAVRFDISSENLQEHIIRIFSLMINTLNQRAPAEKLPFIKAQILGQQRIFVKYALFGISNPSDGAPKNDGMDMQE